ncbi:Uncharacterized protein BCRIVMBC938_03117 [Bacillus wiedmannii]|nr:Uncharacterized protein BCRIVMBC938_03117 [Bacillus wiedmannii]
MSLNMYLGEVQSQTQSMNAICNATIQSMEQAIQSIDAFAIDTVLQGQTYSSAKAYLVQTFRPLAQGIICLCEELIRQNEAFPNDFQAKVASADVIEHEIRQQIQEINQSINCKYRSNRSTYTNAWSRRNYCSLNCNEKKTRRKTRASI